MLGPSGWALSCWAFQKFSTDCLEADSSRGKLILRQNVLDEISACLRNAPEPNADVDQVKAWLFDSRYGVAVRLSRIVQDKAENE